jgi:hypothetical protein
MKILVTGDRYFKNAEVVVNILKSYIDMDNTFIVGGARGVDSLAERYVSSQGCHVAVVNALWGFYGKKAGHLRNKAMLDLKPDLVIAIHPDIENSKGTKNCVKQAEKLGIPVIRRYGVMLQAEKR